MLEKISPLYFAGLASVLLLVQAVSSAYAIDGYDRCALSHGVCKCHKTGSKPSLLATMSDKSLCSTNIAAKGTIVSPNNMGPSPAIAVKAPQKSFLGLHLPHFKLPSLAPAKTEAKYRLCAKRQGVCKCQKVGDGPGVLTVMDPMRCTPPPPVVEIDPPALEDKKSIKEIQRLLKQAGYKPGPVDGSMGNKTETAIKAFQEKNSFKSNGIPSTLLLERLHQSAEKARAQKAIEKAQAAATASSVETKGPHQTIKTVQTKLNRLGYDAGPADGAVGVKTTTAITNFQNAVGMPVDGKVSKALLQRLTDLAPDEVSKPVYTEQTKAAASQAKPASTSTNPLAGLLGKITSKMAGKKRGLPSSASGYRNCARREGRCLCQKLTDDPGVWTTMAATVCTNPNVPAEHSANEPSIPAGPAIAVAIQKAPDPTKTGTKTALQEAPRKGSFFDSIAKALKPDG